MFDYLILWPHNYIIIHSLRVCHKNVLNYSNIGFFNPFSRLTYVWYDSRWEYERYFTLYMCSKIIIYFTSQITNQIAIAYLYLLFHQSADQDGDLISIREFSVLYIRDVTVATCKIYRFVNI